MLAFILLLLGGVGPAKAGDSEPSEAEVKAAFLLNFPKYIEWPAAAFAETNSPFRVCIIGSGSATDEVAAGFEKMIRNKLVNGHPLLLQRLNSASDFQGGCHLVFISADVTRDLPGLLEKIHGASVLLVGESDDFLQRGGIINLDRRDRRIRLQINLDAARHANLKISSKLMSVAEVKGKPD